MQVVYIFPHYTQQRLRQHLPQPLVLPVTAVLLKARRLLAVFTSLYPVGAEACGTRACQR